MKLFILFSVAFFNVSLSMAAMPTCEYRGQTVTGVRSFFNDVRNWTMVNKDMQVDPTNQGSFTVNWNNPVASTFSFKTEKPFSISLKDVYYYDNSCGRLRAKVDATVGGQTHSNAEIKFERGVNGKITISAGGNRWYFLPTSQVANTNQLENLPEGLYPEQGTVTM